MHISIPRKPEVDGRSGVAASVILVEPQEPLLQQGHSAANSGTLPCPMHMRGRYDTMVVWVLKPPGRVSLRLHVAFARPTVPYIHCG